MEIFLSFPIPVIILDSDPSSPSDHGDFSDSSEFGEALEDFARDLPDLEGDSRDFESPVDFAEQLNNNETPEPSNPDPLNYFPSQFPLLDFPIPEGAFCVGPGPVDHEELFNFLTTPSDAIILWYLPDSRLPLGVPIQAFCVKRIRFSYRKGTIERIDLETQR